jgi:aryl-alcohol dehydrogenase-like predicted oxidoreductase
MEFMDKGFYEWHKSTKTPIIPYTSTAYGFFEKLHSLNPVIKEGKVLNTEVIERLDQELVKAYLNKRNISMYEDFLKIHKETGKSLFSLSVAYLTNQPFDTVPVISVSHVSQLNGIREASDIILDSELIQKYQQ